MKIQIKQLSLQNFKGIKDLAVDFTDTNEIFGQNASGKTTVNDGFCWLLFGKDSLGRSDFQIRPVDANGEMINNTEIEVAATLSVDGDDGEQFVTLRKVQVQNWVRKRGSEAPTFSGNTNTYYINDFPSSQKDYDAKVSSLVDEQLFRLLTNPRTFSSMKWQDQRQILLRFVSDVTDEEILDASMDEFIAIRDDVLTAGADKTKSKYTSTLKKLKEDQKAYPVRIDEATRSLVEVEPADVLAKREAVVKAELQAIKEERAKIAESNDDVKRISDSLMEANRQSAEYEINANKELEDRRMRLRSKRADVERAKQEIERLNKDAEHTILSASSTIAEYEAKIKALADEYKVVKNSAMPAESTICPTCKRVLDPDVIEQVRSEFEDNKAKQLERISNDGKYYRSLIVEYTDAIKKAEAEREKFLEQYAEKVEEIAEIDAEYKSIPERSMVRDDESYVAIQNSIANLQDMLDRFPTYDSRKRELDEREQDANECMAEVAKKMSAVENNSRVQERIAELQAAQKECGQMVANCEQKLYLVEKFIRNKMDMLSDRINSHFRKVRFKLFDQQINGAVKETCVMQVASNGSWVDFPNINNAGQIQGGLDVIHALSELYGVTAPIWIDNRESVTEIPDVEAQVINLIVSPEDKVLRIVNK